MVRERLRNNKGSALIAVIVCMLFIGIIASIVARTVLANIENSQIAKKSSENFYEDEVAVDEIKSRLNIFAEEAYSKAYERWLEMFSSLTDQTLGFQNLFAEEFLKTDFSKYFKVGDTDPTLSYIKLLDENYTARGAVKDDGTPIVPWYEYDDTTGQIIIHDLTIILTENGNETMITTDLKISVQTPTMQIGSRVGINTNIADYALVADKTVRFEDCDGTLIVGSIYGGGKDEIDDTKTEYNQPGILLNTNSGVKVYADDMVTRSRIELNKGTLETYGRKQYPWSPSYYYTNIWAQNILMGNSNPNLNTRNSSHAIVQGKCYIADDLTIDTDNSSFTMTGAGSEYYGYNTSSDSADSKSNSSVVVNGKNVTVDFSSAKMLWLAGKSFVSVPQYWGYKNGEKLFPGSPTSALNANSTFMQGDSISYRALQASYMLPGECVVGIYHNPMTMEEYEKITSTDAANAGYYVDIKRGVSGNGMDLELYLDTTDSNTSDKHPHPNSYYAAIVHYGEIVEGETPAQKKQKQLVYLYMNFSNPNRAAAYFSDYSKAFPELVTSRAGMAGNGTSLKVNTTGAAVDSSSGATKLSTSKVVNTGNILWYAPESVGSSKMKYMLYASNTDYTSSKITNMKYTKSMDYQKMETSLSLSSLGSLNKTVTEVMVNYPYFMSGSEEANTRKNKVVKIDGEEGLFYVQGSGETEKRRAYLVAASGDVWITGSGIKFSSLGSVVTTDINDEAIVDKDDHVNPTIKAGLVIAGGDVHIEAGLDFWGTIIAKGDIVFGGSNCSVKIAATDRVRKLIAADPVVAPYFSSDAEEDPETKVSSTIKFEYIDWKKE